jgi:hypothetical protein
VADVSSARCNQRLSCPDRSCEALSCTPPPLSHSPCGSR